MARSRCPACTLIVKAGAPGLERAVAVVADNSWQALQAARQVVVTPSAVDGRLAETSQLAAEYTALLDTAEPVIFRDTVADAD